MNDKKRAGKILSDGLIFQNPLLVMLLGMCPALAVTTTLINGVGMGLCVTAVLMFSNTVVSALRKVIPKDASTAAYILIIASAVTCVDLLLRAFIPSLSSSLGLFIPLIVVNCVILARAEMFASRNGPGYSLLDGFAMGLGFTGALAITSAIREILGSGTILGFRVLPPQAEPALLMTLAPGGFLTLAFVMAGARYIQNLRKGRGG